MFFGFRHGLHHGGVLHGLVLLVLIALIVVGIVAVFRSRSLSTARAAADPGFAPRRPWTAPAPTTDPALSELRVRYARGELTWEEYVQRAGNLGFPVEPGPPGEAGPTPPHPAP